MVHRGASATLAYDAASRLASRTDRLGRRIDYAYDTADRLSTEKWYAAGFPGFVAHSAPPAAELGRL